MRKIEKEIDKDGFYDDGHNSGKWYSLNDYAESSKYFDAQLFVIITCIFEFIFGIILISSIFTKGFSFKEIKYEFLTFLYGICCFVVAKYLNKINKLKSQDLPFYICDKDKFNGMDSFSDDYIIYFEDEDGVVICKSKYADELKKISEINQSYIITKTYLERINSEEFKRMYIDI